MATVCRPHASKVCVDGFRAESRLCNYMVGAHWGGPCYLPLVLLIKRSSRGSISVVKVSASEELRGAGRSSLINTRHSKPQRRLPDRRLTDLHVFAQTLEFRFVACADAEYFYRNGCKARARCWTYGRVGGGTKQNVVDCGDCFVQIRFTGLDGSGACCSFFSLVAILSTVILVGDCQSPSRPLSHTKRLHGCLQGAKCCPGNLGLCSPRT